MNSESYPNNDAEIIPQASRGTLPTVTIIGRPNVGKSSLLNCIAGHRISIVDPTPGITRDRVSTVVDFHGRQFELVDTGGIGVVDEQNLSDHVEEQISFAIEAADIIIFLVDVRSGLTPMDRQVANLLRKLPEFTDRIIVAANKADVQKFDSQVAEFYKLGMGDVMPISAEQKIRIEALLTLVLERLPEAKEIAEVDPALKLALIGKRNVGKSTLTNLLCGEQRVIVSDVPGTTRDAIDVSFHRAGQQFLVIDTAGVRRKRALGSPVDLYSQARSERAIRRADVCLFMMDATQEISIVDKKLAAFVSNESKPCIFCVNKLDLVENASTADYMKYIQDKLHMPYAPVTFISATENVNINATLRLAIELHKQSQMRVGTGRLNTVLHAAIKRKGPKVRKTSKVPKIFYAAQVALGPPTFIIFVNDPYLFDDNYRRFLSNVFRSEFEFEEIPLKLFFRARTKANMETRIKRAKA